MYPASHRRIIEYPRSLLLALGLAVLVAFAGAQRPPRFRPPAGAGLTHLTRLPSAKREQRVRQSPAFQNLTPEEQHKAIQGLRKLNAMPPARQQRVIRGLRAFGKLSARQRQGLRKVYEQFRTMPAADQKAFRAAYQRLRAMPPAQRQQQFRQPALQQHFTPAELKTLQRALALKLPANLVGAG